MSKRIQLNTIDLGGGTTKGCDCEAPNLGDYAKKEDVPTKVSELENDSGFVRDSSLGTAAYKNVEDSLPILIEIGNENPLSAWRDVRQFPKRQIMILQNTSISDTAHVNMFFFDEIIGQHYTDSLSSLTYVEAEMIGLNKGDTTNWNNFNSTAYAYYKVSVYQTNDDMGKEFIGSKIIKVVSPFDGYPSVMFGVESKNHLNMYVAFEDGYEFPNFD